MKWALSTVLLFLCFFLPVQGQTPFTCDGSFYQTIREGTQYKFYLTNPDPVGFTLISNLTAAGLPGEINSIGFNPVDNFIYGINPEPPYRLFRIDATGSFVSLGTISGLSGRNQSGAINNSGELFVCGASGRLYRINLTTRVATLVTTFAFSITDIAFSPSDGQLYGWHASNKQLLRINSVTGAFVTVGPPQPQWAAFGASVFNAQGEIIAYGNDVTNPLDLETLVKINPMTGIVTPLGVGPSTLATDGASCSFGIELTKEVSDDSLSSGATLFFTFRVFNNSGVFQLGVEFADTLPSGMSWVGGPFGIPPTSLSSSSISGGIASINFISLPPGDVGFTFMAQVDPDLTGSCLSLENQAYLNNLSPGLGGSVASDDPTTPAITDPTIVVVNCIDIIPTLGQWGLIILALGLCSLGGAWIFRMKYRQENSLS